ncbi:type III polyketide synthase [Foetidibacter luteolus]|uniref:type III polyketide synthase n=1 Tax=Foetidibacter luteolus TaxID=2608880 RepID=UPI00129BE8ED|nr:type III polyketide synthase [Foetidibacter luteolus]
MAEIVSIATAVPEFCHRQEDILHFMQKAYALDETEKRKLAFLYRHSDIDKRYSVVEDYGRPEQEWSFIPQDRQAPFPLLDERMKLYNECALPLSLKAVESCLQGYISPQQVTHLITVTCTGMSAPGLDLQIAEALQLPTDVFRTSVNFMGCYAAVHALKLAKMICDSTPASHVLIVATELCTLHFQQQYTPDNAASSLLFADGSAAVLVSNQLRGARGIKLKNFYSSITYKGKNDMAWELSSRGFLMKLSGYIPQLVEEDIAALVQKALQHSGLSQKDISHWCLHPGGKRIIEAIQKKLGLSMDDVCYSRTVMRDYGNMSSPSILFVLKDIMQSKLPVTNVFGVAFGPGLTMESFIASSI